MLSIEQATLRHYTLQFQCASQKKGDDHSFPQVKLLMNELFDAQGNFSIEKFDSFVDNIYNGDNAARTKAQAVLIEFQRHPDAWQAADLILQQSQSLQAKFVALSTLDHFVSQRWKYLEQERRLAVRNFIASAIVSLASNQVTMYKEKPLLSKLNKVLVQIAKKEWPLEWPTFIPDIVSISRSNLALCENSIAMLNILCEEIFEASPDDQAKWKTSEMRDQMVSEFDTVFDLLCEILRGAVPSTLACVTLRNLYLFIPHVPLHLLYEKQLLQLLLAKLTSQLSSEEWSLVLKCLSEIVGLPDIPQQYQAQLVSLLPSVMNTVSLKHLDEPTELQDYVLFLVVYLNQYRNILPPDIVEQAHQVLLNISMMDDEELWSLCLEYWNKLVRDSLSHPEHVLNATVYSTLGQVAVDQMVHPNEALHVCSEQGTVSYEYKKESDVATLYESTKELLCNLVRLDNSNVLTTLTNKLATLVGHAPWSWQQLNKVCWALGAIAGAVDQSSTLYETLLVDILQGLSQIVQQSNTQDNKRVAASCLFHVASYYSPFVSRHWDLLNGILACVLRFIHDTEPAVRDVTCRTLVKLCDACRYVMVAPPLAGQGALSDGFVTNISLIVADLEPLQCCLVYKAMGYLFSVMTLDNGQKWLASLMAQPNEKFYTTANQVYFNHAMLRQNEVLQMLLRMLRVHTAICSTAGPEYSNQMNEIHQHLARLYDMIGAEMELTSDVYVSRLQKRVREQIEALVKTFAQEASNLRQSDVNMIFAMLDRLLASPTEKQESTDILCTLLEKTLHPDLVPFTLRVFARTFQEIGHDFIEHYERRPGFYRMVQSLVKYRFRDILHYDQIQAVIDSILWGIKHPGHEIANLALECCSLAIEQIANYEGDEQDDTQNELYQRFFMVILHVTVQVITDRDRRTQFEKQSVLLARLLELVQEGDIHTQLSPDAGITSNAEFVQTQIRRWLGNIYPQLPSEQIDRVVYGMLEYSGELDRFREDWIDFMADFQTHDDFSTTQVTLDAAAEQALWESLGL